LGHGGTLSVEANFSIRTFSDIFGHAALFDWQRAKHLSTSNGRAARQGDQWRNMFLATPDFEPKSTKKSFAGAIFHFWRAARLA
jgi:hypothetical protein